MNFLNSWLQGIVISVIIATIIEMILPDGNTKKYIKVVLGVYIVFNIITPIVNQFTNSKFELSSIINIEEYTNKMETYEVASKNIDESNEENIKQMYITNLERDIASKLKEKDYFAKKVEVKIEDNETYNIKSINLFLEKIQQEEILEQEDKLPINEIQTVEIKIGEEKEQTEEWKDNITDTEKNEIKNYLSSVYEIKEKQIIIN